MRKAERKKRKKNSFANKQTFQRDIVCPRPSPFFNPVANKHTQGRGGPQEGGGLAERRAKRTGERESAANMLHSPNISPLSTYGFYLAGIRAHGRKYVGYGRHA